MNVIHFLEIDDDLAPFISDEIGNFFEEKASLIGIQLSRGAQNGNVVDLLNHSYNPKSASFPPSDVRSFSACSKTFCHLSRAQISIRLVIPTMTTSFIRPP